MVVCTNCLNPSPSADGRLIAFETKHRDGTPNDVFVHNMDLGTDELMSADFAGMGGGNGDSYRPLMSYDGRSVVFVSKASNLVSNDFNRTSDIFIRDRWKGVMTLLSSNYHGTGSANGPSSAPVLAPDGRTIAFQSFANDLVPGDFNELRDIFVLRLARPDTDGDGMDDDWETAYFGSLSHDGTADSDGDGRTDLQEFRAGTDPTNAGSVMSLLTITTIASGYPGYTQDTTVYWRAAPGRTYRLQFKDDLSDPFWTTVPGDIVTGATRAAKFHSTPAGPTPDSQRFYRIVLVE